MILAGDIGGTKTELGLYRGATELERARFVSHDYPNLEAVVREFLGGRHVDSAAFAVAGPVHAGRCQITNLPWELDEQALAVALGAKVALLNDLAGAVLGIGELESTDFGWLAEHACDPHGPIAAIGAGTGLGEAVGVPLPDGSVHVLPSEGGHADFAPRNDVEIELLRFLQHRHGRHVSFERVLSGPGLCAIYDFVVERGLSQSSDQVKAAIQANGAAEMIAKHGSAGDDPACERALSIFIELYGAEAGNLALKVLPTGGLFLVGGIAPKLLATLRSSAFMHAMLDKGRMASVLERIPVAVVTNPHVVLLGALARARAL